jgi:hypothetical protein
MQRRCSYLSYKLCKKNGNGIHMKELASGKYMENDCFLRTLKFKMPWYWFLLWSLCLLLGSGIHTVSGTLHAGPKWVLPKIVQISANWIAHNCWNGTKGYALGPNPNFFIFHMVVYMAQIRWENFVPKQGIWAKVFLRPFYKLRPTWDRVTKSFKWRKKLRINRK